MKPNEELLQKIGQVRTKWKTLLWVRGLAWVLGVLVASIARGVIFRQHSQGSILASQCLETGGCRRSGNRYCADAGDAAPARSHR